MPLQNLAQSPPQPLPQGKPVGIDVGLTSFVATSNGVLVNEYVANCRKDWHRKLSHQICFKRDVYFEKVDGRKKA